MKRILSIVLLSAVLYNSVGYFVAFRVLHQQVKQHVWKVQKEQLAGSRMEIIRMPAEAAESPIQFVNKNEFRYEGKLYDLIRTEQVGNEILFYCINDTEEEQLLTSLREQSQQQNGQPAQNAKQVLSLVIKDFIPETVSSFNLTLVATIKPVAFYWLSLTGSYSGIITPPPRHS